MDDEEENVFELPDMTELPLDECCICGEQPVTALIRIDQEPFPFCGKCDHRSAFLQRGQALKWPDLRIEGVTGDYAMDGSPQAYALTVLQGTDERVCELLDALDEYESQAKAS